jgi:hypothetical protein
VADKRGMAKRQTRRRANTNITIALRSTKKVKVVKEDLSLPNQTNCCCIPWERHPTINPTQKLCDWYQINQSINQSINRSLDQSRKQKRTATLNDPRTNGSSNPDAD